MMVMMMMKSKASPLITFPCSKRLTITRRYASISVMHLLQPCKAVYKMAHGKKSISTVHSKTSAAACKELTQLFTHHPF